MSVDNEALRLARDAHKASAALAQRLEAWQLSSLRGSLLDSASASESLLEDIVARLASFPLKETEKP